MSTTHSAFWDDLSADLADPEFRSEFILQSIRIATIDRVIEELDHAREAAGLSKAALARIIHSEPATVRRLFSAHQVNPTLGTLSEVAAALGMQVVLAPLDGDGREAITEPLLTDRDVDTQALARRLSDMRERAPVPA